MCWNIKISDDDKNSVIPASKLDAGQEIYSPYTDDVLLTLNRKELLCLIRHHGLNGSGTVSLVIRHLSHNCMNVHRRIE